MHFSKTSSTEIMCLVNKPYQVVHDVYFILLLVMLTLITWSVRFLHYKRYLSFGKIFCSCVNSLFLSKFHLLIDLAFTDNSQKKHSLLWLLPNGGFLFPHLFCIYQLAFYWWKRFLMSLLFYLIYIIVDSWSHI